LALPATAWLWQDGYLATHDGLHHLFRLAALDDALHQGVVYPRWFPDFAFGYGQPILNYYVPLSYYWGLTFHLLGLGYVSAIKVAFASGYLLSAVTMYAYARTLVGVRGGLVAAVAYVYFPYHLVETYVRGALSEHLALVWMPLVLLAAHRMFEEKASRGWLIVLGALAYVGLILTHTLTTVIFTPVAVAYAFWRLVEQIRRHNSQFAIRNSQFAVRLAVPGLLSPICSLFLALGLTAFYWLPVVAESRWVGLWAATISDAYKNHLAPLRESISPFLVYRYYPNQGVAADYPFGLIWGLLFAISLFVAAWLWRKQRQHAEYLLFFQGVVLVSAFMMVDASLGVWRAFQSVLSFLQFPWRFMSLAALGLAIVAGALGGLMTDKRPGLRVGASAMLSLVLVMPSLADLPVRSLPMREAEVDARRMWREDFETRQIGATWNADYQPEWVKADRTAVPLPLAQPRSEIQVAANPRLAPNRIAYLERAYTVQSSAPLRLRFHTFYYPGWRGYVDGMPVPTYPVHEMGLLSLDVPAGEHRIELRFEDTWPRALGNSISLITLVGMAVSVLWMTHKDSRQWSAVSGWWLAIANRQSAMAIFLVVVGVSSSVLHYWPRPVSATIPLAARIGEGVQLIGYRLDQTTYRPGDTVRATLYWFAEAETRENWKVFVHLTDTSGAAMLAQHDGDPVGGFTPTTRWLAGELIEDTHWITIPLDMASGEYRLWVGMYRFETRHNLPAALEGKPVRDGRVSLGEITVR